MNLLASLQALRRRGASWLEGHVSVLHKLALLMAALTLPLAIASGVYWHTTEKMTGQSRGDLDAVMYLDGIWPAMAAAAAHPDRPVAPALKQQWAQAADRYAAQFGGQANAARFAQSLDGPPTGVVGAGFGLIVGVAQASALGIGDRSETTVNLWMTTSRLPYLLMANDRLARAMAAGDGPERLRAAGAFDIGAVQLGVIADGAAASDPANRHGLAARTEEALAAVTRVSELARFYAADGAPDAHAAAAFGLASNAAAAAIDRAWRASSAAARDGLNQEIAEISARRRAGLAAWLALLGLNGWLAIALARSIVSPQRKLIDTMSRLMAGETDIETPYRRYDNETGDMARAVEVFRRTLIERKALERDLEEGRRALEQRVTERTRALENANSAKTNFVASLSHEIRTPLNGVLGMAAALAATPLNGHQRGMVKVITDSGDVLLRLLNNAIDISRIESGKVELDPAPFVLGEMVEAVASLYRESAKAKQLWLDVAIAPEAEGRYHGDAVRLRQILQNFVSNAVKFTERGGVSIAIANTSGPNSLSFEVSDTGVGLPAEPDMLFESFNRGDRAMARRFSGAGLGLTISKHLAEAMGGTITAAGRPGGGSAFRFEVALERRAEPSAPEAQAAPSPLQGVRILAADDNAMNLMVLEAVLEQLGVDADFVGGGRDALAAALTLPYDVLILDIRMPDMDGLAVTRAVRASAGPNRATPIIAVSGDAMPEQIAKHLAAGVNAHVPKPVHVPTLAAAISSVLRDRTSDAQKRRSA